MRIIQFCFSLTSGGAEKFTVDLANELVKNNEVYFCVVLSESIEKHNFFRNQLNSKIEYINLNCFKGLSVKAHFKVLKLIIDLKPDVIHFHLNTIIYFYLPSLIFNKRIKFVHTLHNIAPKTIGFKWQKFLNRIYYKKEFIKAVAISKECEISFKDFYKHDRVVLVDNGVSSPLRSNRYSDVVNEISNLKFSKTDKVFVHVATFEEQKNQDLLIDVFNKLLMNKKELILLVIGKYFDSPGGLKLKDKSCPGIYFLGTKSNISDYLFASDAFVLSSLWEGLPISLLEALSCGTIPVCTPAGGIPDVIEKEEYGFLSRDFSEKALYEVVLKCHNEMGSFNRSNLTQLFEEKYSISNCSIKYLKVYR